MEVEEPLQAVAQRVRALSRKLVTGSEGKSLREHLAKEMAKPVRVKLKDKLSFTLGLMNVLITEYFLLNTPKLFYRWYLFWAFPLMGLRWFTYKGQNMQFFLFDFCYFANLLCIVNVLLLPSNRALFEIVFVCCNGPLLMAILAWRNSLVFHSLDKVTTLFVHAFPPMVTWAERWYGRYRDSAGVCSGRWSLTEGWLDFSAYEAADVPGAPPCALDWATGLWYPLLMYAAWQVAYLLKTEVWDAKKLREDRGILTSSRWFIQARSGALYGAALAAARRLGVVGPTEHFDAETATGKAVFVVCQFLYTVICMAPVVAMYSNWYVHSAILLAVLTNSAWNGASYYFEVFSKKYQERLVGALARSDAAGKPRAGSDTASEGSSVTAEGEDSHAVSLDDSLEGGEGAAHEKAD